MASSRDNAVFSLILKMIPGDKCFRVARNYVGHRGKDAMSRWMQCFAVASAANPDHTFPGSGTGSCGALLTLALEQGGDKE